MRASEPAVTVPTSNASICPGRFVSVGVVAVSDPKRSVPGRMGAGAALLTVTVTGADVVLLPAASRATAVIVCVPFVTVAEFQLTEYGDVVSSGGIAVPSTLNVTPTTPMLSAALALTAIVPVTEPAAGAVSETVGAVESATDGTTAE